MTQKFKGILFYDLDGTLYRGQLFVDWLYALVEFGLWPESFRKKLDKAKEGWEKRQEPFDKFIYFTIGLIEENLKGLSVVESERVMDVVVQRTNGHVYRYTRELLKKKKLEGWYTCLISASMEYAVKRFAEKWGFHQAYGTRMFSKNGLYTGERDIVFVDRKVAFMHFVKQELSDYNINPMNIWAVGDSESDVPMLQNAGVGICMNPTAEFFERSREEGWYAVIERKDLILEFAPYQAVPRVFSFDDFGNRKNIKNVTRF